MAQDLIAYAGSYAIELPPADVPDVSLQEGQSQAIHIFLDADRVEDFTHTIEQWFENRDEVIYVASGVSAQGIGFVLLEWEECPIDPLFISILRCETYVQDFCLYIRESEVEA